NCILIKQMPSTILRFEHQKSIPQEIAINSLSIWPHFRENSSVCWSFEPPPIELGRRYSFELRGRCQDWRNASGPDINFFNLGKKVVNSALRHKVLALGLARDPDTGR